MYKVTRPYGMYQPGDKLGELPDGVTPREKRIYFADLDDESGTETLESSEGVAALRTRLDDADYTTELRSWASTVRERTGDDFDSWGAETLIDYLLAHPEVTREVIDED